MQSKRVIAVLAAMLMVLGLTAGPAFSSSSGELVPFTQQELNDNWVPDRRAPSGGYESVSPFQGRSDVLNIGIDSSAAASGTFNRTEGIKKMEDFGSDRKLGINLYIDPAWEDNAVRAGLWLAGWDPERAPDGQGRQRSGEFAMIDFATADELFAPPLVGPVGKNERFRVWHSSSGWVDLPAVPVTYGQWVTLEIELVLDNDRYDYFIDGALVHSASNAAFNPEFVGEVFVNQYNYGREEMAAGFNNDDYEVHWHVWASPADRDACMKGGWEDFGFRNQGQCIQFVSTGMDSR